MIPTIRKTNAYSKKDSCFILLDDSLNLPGGIFSKQEAGFIIKELNEKRNPVVVNQLSRFAIVYRLDGKKSAMALAEACRKAGDQTAGLINKQKRNKLTIIDQAGKQACALAVAEGMMLGCYQFLRYRNAKKKDINSLSQIAIKSKGLQDKMVNELAITCQAVVHTRDLVNEPQSFLTAARLSEAFARMGKEAGFKVQVLRKDRIKKLKMGGLLAVNKGSVQPPTFTVMEWKPRNAKNKKPVVLIGKGVVYDTGGLSLKPTPNSMDYMKCDMAGAAVVAGALYAIARSRLPVHVIALAPATDNRPSGDAYAPGDVVKMMSGQTVEVLNTDAEGRMILADALHYAKRYKPELVMDFATLTGAAAAAIGHYGIVCMGTADEKQKNLLKESGNSVYERLAEFPIWDEYDDLIKSDIAEMKNIGGPVAGAITAGKFLQRFIDYPWMHFDIAGPAFVQSPSSYLGKGATGIGVRLMVEFFKNYNSKK